MKSDEGLFRTGPSTRNPALPHLPARPDKPRDTGVTMVMDKGLSVLQAEDLAATAGPLVDYVKFGFGTALVARGTKEKAAIYRAAGIRAYLGGTLFEAFLVRGRFDDYRRFVDDLGLDTVEVSDGSMPLDPARKCELIHTLARDCRVLSEVGAKRADRNPPPERWPTLMQAELEAGAHHVIAEARESGNLGIYRGDGSPDSALIDRILAGIPAERVIWEAPAKAQQVWFVKRLGPNVNLGNIAPDEAVSLETIRIGLRGDTFRDYLPAALLLDGARE